MATVRTAGRTQVSKNNLTNKDGKKYFVAGVSEVDGEDVAL
jgi:hypothetical protein